MPNAIRAVLEGIQQPSKWESWPAASRTVSRHSRNCDVDGDGALLSRRSFLEAPWHGAPPSSNPEAAGYVRVSQNDGSPSGAAQMTPTHLATHADADPMMGHIPSGVSMAPGATLVNTESSASAVAAAASTNPGSTGGTGAATASKSSDAATAAASVALAGGQVPCPKVTRWRLAFPAVAFMLAVFILVGGAYLKLGQVTVEEEMDLPSGASLEISTLNCDVVFRKSTVGRASIYIRTWTFLSVHYKLNRLAPCVRCRKLIRIRGSQASVRLHNLFKYNFLQCVVGLHIPEDYKFSELNIEMKDSPHTSTVISEVPILVENNMSLSAMNAKMHLQETLGKSVSIKLLEGSVSFRLPENCSSMSPFFNITSRSAPVSVTAQGGALQMSGIDKYRAPLAVLAAARNLRLNGVSDPGKSQEPGGAILQSNTGTCQSEVLLSGGAHPVYAVATDGHGKIQKDDDQNFRAYYGEMHLKPRAIFDTRRKFKKLFQWQQAMPDSPFIIFIYPVAPHAPLGVWRLMSSRAYLATTIDFFALLSAGMLVPRSLAVQAPLLGLDTFPAAPSKTQLMNYRWDVGKWMQCSVSCGGGWQWRRVDCVQEMLDGSLAKVSDSWCEEAAPIETEKPCAPQPCPDDDSEPHTPGLKVPKVPLLKRRLADTYSTIEANGSSSTGMTTIRRTCEADVLIREFKAIFSALPKAMRDKYRIVWTPAEGPPVTYGYESGLVTRHEVDLALVGTFYVAASLNLFSALFLSAIVIYIIVLKVPPALRLYMSGHQVLVSASHRLSGTNTDSGGAWNPQACILYDPRYGAQVSWVKRPQTKLFTAFRISVRCIEDHPRNSFSIVIPKALSSKTKHNPDVRCAFISQNHPGRNAVNDKMKPYEPFHKPLTQKCTYLFSVAGIGADGRVVEHSHPSSPLYMATGESLGDFPFLMLKLSYPPRADSFDCFLKRHMRMMPSFPDGFPMHLHLNVIEKHHSALHGTECDKMFGSRPYKIKVFFGSRLDVIDEREQRTKTQQEQSFGIWCFQTPADEDPGNPQSVINLKEMASTCFSCFTWNSVLLVRLARLSPAEDAVGFALTDTHDEVLAYGCTPVDRILTGIGPSTEEVEKKVTPGRRKDYDARQLKWRVKADNGIRTFEKPADDAAETTTKYKHGEMFYASRVASNAVGTESGASNAARWVMLASSLYAKEDSITLVDDERINKVELKVVNTRTAYVSLSYEAVISPLAHYLVGDVVNPFFIEPSVPGIIFDQGQDVFIRWKSRNEFLSRSRINQPVTEEQRVLSNEGMPRQVSPNPLPDQQENIVNPNENTLQVNARDLHDLIRLYLVSWPSMAATCISGKEPLRNNISTPTDSCCWSANADFEPSENGGQFVIAATVGAKVWDGLDSTKGPCLMNYGSLYPENNEGFVTISHCFRIARVTLLSEVELAYAAFCRQYGMYMESVTPELLAAKGVQTIRRDLRVLTDRRRIMPWEAAADLDMKVVPCCGQQCIAPLELQGNALVAKPLVLQNGALQPDEWRWGCGDSETFLLSKGLFYGSQALYLLRTTLLVPTGIVPLYRLAVENGYVPGFVQRFLSSRLSIFLENCISKAIAVLLFVGQLLFFSAPAIVIFVLLILQSRYQHLAEPFYHTNVSGNYLMDFAFQPSLEFLVELPDTTKIWLCGCSAYFVVVVFFGLLFSNFAKDIPGLAKCSSWINWIFAVLNIVVVFVGIWFVCITVLWFVLGALIDPSALMPYAVAVGAVGGTASSLWKQFMDMKDQVSVAIMEHIEELMQYVLDSASDLLGINLSEAPTDDDQNAVTRHTNTQKASLKNKMQLAQATKNEAKQVQDQQSRLKLEFEKEREEKKVQRQIEGKIEEFEKERKRLEDGSYNTFEEKINLILEVTQTSGDFISWDGLQTLMCTVDAASIKIEEFEARKSKWIEGFNKDGRPELHKAAADAKDKTPLGVTRNGLIWLYDPSQVPASSAFGSMLAGLRRAGERTGIVEQERAELNIDAHVKGIQACRHMEDPETAARKAIAKFDAKLGARASEESDMMQENEYQSEEELDDDAADEAAGDEEIGDEDNEDDQEEDQADENAAADGGADALDANDSIINESKAFKQLANLYHWSLGLVQAEFVKGIVKDVGELAEMIVGVQDRLVAAFEETKRTDPELVWGQSQENDEDAEQTHVPVYLKEQRDIIIKEMRPQIGIHLAEFYGKVFDPSFVRTKVQEFFGKKLVTIVESKARLLESAQMELEQPGDYSNTELKWDERTFQRDWDPPLTVAHVLKRLDLLSRMEEGVRSTESKMTTRDDEVLFVIYVLAFTKVLTVFINPEETSLTWESREPFTQPWAESQDRFFVELAAKSLGADKAFLCIRGDPKTRGNLCKNKGNWIGEGIVAVSESLEKAIRSAIDRNRRSHMLTMNDMSRVIKDLLFGHLWPANFFYLLRLMGLDIHQQYLNHGDVRTGDQTIFNAKKIMSLIHEKSFGTGLVEIRQLLPSIMELTQQGIPKEAAVIFLKDLGAGAELGNKYLGKWESRVMELRAENDLDLAASGEDTRGSIDWTGVPCQWHDQEDYEYLPWVSNTREREYISEDWDVWKPNTDKLAAKWIELTGSENGFITLSEFAEFISSVKDLLSKRKPPKTMREFNGTCIIKYEATLENKEVSGAGVGLPEGTTATGAIPTDPGGTGAPPTTSTLSNAPPANSTSSTPGASSALAKRNQENRRLEKDFQVFLSIEVADDGIGIKSVWYSDSDNFPTRGDVTKDQGAAGGVDRYIITFENLDITQVLPPSSRNVTTTFKVNLDSSRISGYVEFAGELEPAPPESVLRQPSVHRVELTEQRADKSLEEWMICYEGFHHLLLKMGLELDSSMTRMLFGLIFNGRELVRQRDIERALLNIPTTGKGSLPLLRQPGLARSYLTLGTFQLFLQRLGITIPPKNAKNIWDDFEKDSLSLGIDPDGFPLNIPSGMDPTGQDPTRGKFVTFARVIEQLVKKVLRKGLWPEAIVLIVKDQLKIASPEASVRHALQAVKLGRYGTIPYQSIIDVLVRLGGRGLDLPMFKQLISRLSLNVGEHDIKKAFDLMDVNNDGAISVAEFLGGMRVILLDFVPEAIMQASGLTYPQICKFIGATIVTILLIFAFIILSFACFVAGGANGAFAAIQSVLGAGGALAVNKSQSADVEKTKALILEKIQTVMNVSQKQKSSASKPKKPADGNADATLANAATVHEKAYPKAIVFYFDGKPLQLSKEEKNKVCWRVERRRALDQHRQRTKYMKARFSGALLREKVRASKNKAIKMTSPHKVFCAFPQNYSDCGRRLEARITQWSRPPTKEDISSLQWSMSPKGPKTMLLDDKGVLTLDLTLGDETPALRIPKTYSVTARNALGKSRCRITFSINSRLWLLNQFHRKAAGKPNHKTTDEITMYHETLGELVKKDDTHDLEELFEFYKLFGDDAPDKVLMLAAIMKKQKDSVAFDDKEIKIKEFKSNLWDKKRIAALNNSIGEVFDFLAEVKQEISAEAVPPVKSLCIDETEQPHDQENVIQSRLDQERRKINFISRIKIIQEQMAGTDTRYDPSTLFKRKEEDLMTLEKTLMRTKKAEKLKAEYDVFLNKLDGVEGDRAKILRQEGLKMTDVKVIENELKTRSDKSIDLDLLKFKCSVFEHMTNVEHAKIRQAAADLVLLEDPPADKKPSFFGRSFFGGTTQTQSAGEDIIKKCGGKPMSADQCTTADQLNPMEGNFLKARKERMMLELRVTHIKTLLAEQEGADNDPQKRGALSGPAIKEKAKEFKVQLETQRTKELEMQWNQWQVSTIGQRPEGQSYGPPRPEVQSYPERPPPTGDTPIPPPARREMR